MGIEAITIGKRKVGPDEPVFIIAEAGVNHNGSLEIAKKLVNVAVDAGADAVKFQTFVAEEVMTHRAPKAKYQLKMTQPEESQLDMAKKLELPPAAFQELARYCTQRGIWFLSTPFDFPSVDVLDQIGVPLFKIASGDLNNIPLLTYVAEKGRPIILSTGMSYPSEVDEATRAIFATGNKQLILLHCTSNYPASVEAANLRAILALRSSFPALVGYSDHTLGIEVAVAAVALEACVIEKHFTIDRGLPGPDHRASLEPHELKQLVQSIRNVENALGDGLKRPMEEELMNRPVARKSLVARCRIAKGKTVTRDMIAIKRPGDGIEPKFLDLIIGKRINCDLQKDETFRWEMILQSRG